jgi:hypothetical protein
MYTIEDLKNVEVPEGTSLHYSEVINGVCSVLSELTGEEKSELYFKLNMSKKGDVASGTICSPKLALGIHWTHSYNKTLRFSLSLVAYGKSSNLIYTSEDVKVHAFKKGAEQNQENFLQSLKEIKAEILDGISKQKLISFRKKLQEIPMSWKDCYHHAADLYFDKKFLSPQQLSAYQTEVDPLKNVEDNSITVWSNFVCYLKAIEDSSPKNWLKDNRELSSIIKPSKSYSISEAPKEKLESLSVLVEEVQETQSMAEGIIPEDLTGSVKIMSPDQAKDISEKNKKVQANTSSEEIIYEKQDEDDGVNQAEFEAHVEKEEPAPKKGLGLFAKITKKVVSENTGKGKTIIVLDQESENKEIPAIELSEEQIEVIIQEREEKAVKSTTVSDTLVDEEPLPEIEHPELFSESELIDELNIPDVDDFEQDFGIEDESEEESKEIKIELDDFGVDVEGEETDEVILNHGQGKQPDDLIVSGSVTMYKFNDKNLTVIVQTL